ncbi:hypothetical protein [Paenibacillus camerounensis]|uniref:hypothetical protein n=1 Tax=Paenibacillus camerounensis TaxID=1243663 RepID=UPI0005AA839B|nr:hypothetical protein [Paenibacillus camerounensis]
MKFWKERSGNGFPLTVAAVLAVLMISCVIYEYLRLSIIASHVRDAVQSAVISVATENYSNVYSGLRQSYSGGFVRSGNQWKESWTTGDVYRRISQDLGLTQERNRYVRKSNQIIEYSISDLQVNVINTPFAPLFPDFQSFTAEAQIHLTVPLSFGWGHLPPMQANLEMKAAYRPKF